MITRKIIEAIKKFLDALGYKDRIYNIILLYDGINFINSYSPCDYTDKKVIQMSEESHIVYLGYEKIITKNQLSVVYPKIIFTTNYDPIDIMKDNYARMTFDISSLDSGLSILVNNGLDDNGRLIISNNFDVDQSIINKHSSVLSMFDSYETTISELIGRMISANDKNIISECKYYEEYDDTERIDIVKIREKVNNIEYIIDTVCEGYKDDDVFVFIDDIIKDYVYDCFLNPESHIFLFDCIKNTIAKYRKNICVSGLVFAFDPETITEQLQNN